MIGFENQELNITGISISKYIYRGKAKNMYAVFSYNHGHDNGQNYNIDFTKIINIIASLIYVPLATSPILKLEHRYNNQVISLLKGLQVNGFQLAILDR